MYNLLKTVFPCMAFWISMPLIDALSSVLPQLIKHMILCLTNSFDFVSTWAHVCILASRNYWRLSERNHKTKLLINPVFPSIHHQQLDQYHFKPCVNVLRVHPEWMLRLLHRVLQLGAGLQKQVGLVSTDDKIMKMHHENRGQAS